MPTATASIKRCSGCHKDVTSDKRMKDSSGRYWCINCGTEQQKKKAILAAENRTYQVAASSGTDKGRLMKLLVVMGLLAAGAAWSFTAMH
jgi:hypothetical protein